MGLIKLGLVGAAGYAVARKVNHHRENKHNGQPSQTDDRSTSFRDTKSGYMHQGYCNGKCGRTCNGQQTYGLHDWTCSGQCGGQCVTQRRTAGSQGPPMQHGDADQFYGAGGLGGRERLPSYDNGPAPATRVADVKA